MPFKASPSGDVLSSEVGDVENGKEKTKVQAKVDISLLIQFVILGFVALAPWNFVLADIDYLDRKFGHHFAATTPIFYSIAVNFAQMLLIWVGNKFTFAPRFDWGCIILSIFNILLAVVAMLIGNGNPVDDAGLGYGLGLCCVFLLGFGHAVMESSSFGLAALCPQSCMIAVMTGEGIAGLVGWPLNMLLQVIMEAGNVPRREEWQCLVFFCVTSAITMFIVPMFRVWTSKHPFMAEVLKIEAKRSKETLTHRQTRRPVWAIVKDVAPMAFCAWCSLGVTFVVFPAQVVLWRSQDPNNDGFVPQVIYTFQVVDTVGRFLPSFGISMPNLLLACFVLGRSIFIPLFICTSLYPTVKPFYWDWFKHVDMALFALTNGMGCTISMVKGPSRVSQDKAEQEVAGYTMAFALIFGILCGSVFGLCAHIGLGQ
ncbi:equilibrative nucleoside transporter, putative [Perkinsus marinus ATCC 50983]|uniref:Equilibrative nucleoside transporter, putative n=1 Tax=Perkinsus marinus (strain ATCC 50983 / TXsc) TaxID=423536 RepID=C5KS94_PERM5|nr:equilibrative nucleoside transporter, putative [Perkinsus marinus ATCC 50983]EER12675.1 equilibrative nucleoside transporter, putative [Perkinsus marinus ATCC 50983]|eukprot:XP_002780880.1 equilibrative nucleoside transporter, putative [Perkinsus marinus ATCC 50983]